MGQIDDLGQAFQRDFVVDGMPVSGVNEPDKAIAYRSVSLVAASTPVPDGVFAN